jgi:hypothetical protein
VVKVYIAGPIKGYDNLNQEAFTRRAEVLRQMGHEPLSPLDIKPDHDRGICCGGTPSEPTNSNHKYGCFLRADLVEMMYCDGITLLPGWERSVGASTEEHVARSLGLQFVEVEL